MGDWVGNKTKTMNRKAKGLKFVHSAKIDLFQPNLPSEN